MKPIDLFTRNGNAKLSLTREIVEKFEVTNANIEYGIQIIDNKKLLCIGIFSVKSELSILNLYFDNKSCKKIEGKNISTKTDEIKNDLTKSYRFICDTYYNKILNDKSF